MKNIYFITFLFDLIIGKEIKFKLEQTFGDYYINLGNKYYIDTENFFIISSKIKSKQEIIKPNYNIEYKETKYIGQLIESEISINNKTNFRLKMISINNNGETEINKLGLGYEGDSEENKYSFINQLYEQKLITRKIFTLNLNKSFLEFGYFPNYKEENINYGKCSLIKNIKYDNQYFPNRNWQCKFKGFFIGNKKNKLIPIEEKYSIITLLSFKYHEKINIPLSLFRQLEENYFKKLLIQKKCVITNRFDHLVFACNDTKNIKNDIYLSFGNWAMKIPKERIFYKQEIGCFDINDYVSIFQFDIKNGDSLIILNTKIMEEFVILYDYENKEIGFYSEKYISKVDNNIIKENSMHLFIYLILIIFLIYIGLKFSKQKNLINNRNIKYNNQIELNLIQDY